MAKTQAKKTTKAVNLYLLGKDKGATIRGVAAAFGIAPSTLMRAIKRNERKES